MKTVRRFTHFRMKSVRNPEWNEYSKKIFLLHMDGRLLNHVFIHKRSGTWVGIVTGEGGNEHIHITLLQIFLRSQLLQHCTAALQNSRTPSNKICVGGGVGDEYDNKIFFSNLDDCVCAQMPAEPSLHWERMQGFQTQKRLYNCRCPSVIITFFKIFSRKNDSTFVNVCPWSSLSSKLIILINWKKFSSHLSVFSDAIKGRLQKKEGR